MICISHHIILGFSNQGGSDVEEIRSNIQNSNHSFSTIRSTILKSLSQRQKQVINPRERRCSWDGTKLLLFFTVSATKNA